MLYAIKITYGNNKITGAIDASIPSATTFPTRSTLCRADDLSTLLHKLALGVVQRRFTSNLG